MRSPVITAFLSLVLVSPAFAQAPVPTLSQGDEGALTLRDALDQAFERNPELVALRRGYGVAAAQPAEARYLESPMLEAQIWEWPLTTLNPARTGMYMFTVEQQLPGRGKRASRALVAEREADLVRRQVGVRTNEVLDEVRQAFAELALARDIVRLFDGQMPVLRSIADAATYRYAAGHAGQHDSLASVLELSRLQGDALGWRLRAQRAEAVLTRLMGRAPGTAVEALMPQTLTVIPFDPTAVALERHPDMAVANAMVAREEAELARLTGERRPDFVVGGGYMLTPGNAGAWTARGGITWPNAPWSRGRLDTAIDVQRQRAAAAGAAREAVAAAIRGGVRDAELRLEAARERVGLMANTIIPHAEHAFEISQAAYAANRGEFDDVVSGQRALLGARIEYAESRAEFELALAQLERAMGDARDDRWPATGNAAEAFRETGSRVEGPAQGGRP
jgi:cobalt-zinc-cadmium efflux system outer membrane protein